MSKTYSLNSSKPSLGMRMFFLAITLFGISPYAFAGDPCPKDFPKFLNRFGTDRTFQEAHTRYPLSYISNTGHSESCAYPDCPLVESKLSRKNAAKLSEPIFPLAKTKEDLSLEKKIKSSKDKTLVEIYKPDSDSYLIVFTFKRVSSCWQLISVADHSI